MLFVPSKNKDTTHLDCLSLCLWATALECKSSQDQNQTYSQYPSHTDTIKKQPQRRRPLYSTDTECVIVSVFYLRTWVIQVCVARIHVLCHDDEGQQVGGGESARIAARVSGQAKRWYML